MNPGKSPVLAELEFEDAELADFRKMAGKLHRPARIRIESACPGKRFGYAGPFPQHNRFGIRNSAFWEVQPYQFPPLIHQTQKQPISP